MEVGTKTRQPPHNLLGVAVQALGATNMKLLQEQLRIFPTAFDQTDRRLRGHMKHRIKPGQGVLSPVPGGGAKERARRMKQMTKAASK